MAMSYFLQSELHRETLFNKLCVYVHINTLQCHVIVDSPETPLHVNAMNPGLTQVTVSRSLEDSLGC